VIDVAVLGAGGVGGFLAAALERAADRVTVVAREETAAAIAAEGLTVESARLGELRTRPEAVPVLDRDVDALVVAVKASGLDDSLERIQAEPHLVVPMLNGLDHVDRLRQRFGPRAVAAAIRIEATRVGPARIDQTSPFLAVELASADPRMRRSIDAFAELLNRAGVPARVRESEADVMWGKLVRLCPLALVTTAYDLPLGPISSTPELRADLEACVTEAAAVATADGSLQDPAATIAELAEAHPGLDSSMHRDVAAGREPELDAIAGAVLRAAARHGLSCPTIERLAERVRSATPAPPR
jgi:2-dehydropantoate 2-reductase